MTIELHFTDFSDTGIASRDPLGRSPRPSRQVVIANQDVVYLEETPFEYQETYYRVTLRTPDFFPREMTWWKGIKFVDQNGVERGSVDMQDHAHGPEAFDIDPLQIEGGKLVFMKAKLFGIHTDMYHLPLTGIRQRKIDWGYHGMKQVQTLSFYWQYDDGPGRIA